MRSSAAGCAGGSGPHPLPVESRGVRSEFLPHPSAPLPEEVEFPVLRQWALMKLSTRPASVAVTFAAVTRLAITRAAVACAAATLAAFALGAAPALAAASALSNPGFELGVGFPGWTVFSGTPDLFQLSEEARSGLYSLRLTDPSPEQAVGLRSEHVAVEPGAVYRATAWIGTESGTAQLYLEFWDAAGTRIDVVFDGASASTWRAVTLERQAPEGAATATVLLYGHRSNRGVMYFDDIQLVRQAGPDGAAPSSLSAKSVLFPRTPVWPERPGTPEQLSEGFEVNVASHPRLFVTKEDLPRRLARAANGQTPFGVDLREALRQLEAAADQHRRQTSFTVAYYGGHTVTYPLPPRQPDPMPNPPLYVAGPYPYWTAMAGQLRNRLVTLAGAYLFTGNPAYAETAKRDMLALAAWDTWSDPTYPCGGQTCLDTGYIVDGVAFAFDVLYDVLNADERELLKTAIIEKGLKPLYADTARYIDHNIHMVRTAALGLGALLLLNDAPDMERYLARAYENFLWYLDQRITTGATEGMLYTSVAMEHIIKFADALERVTGDRSLFDHPYVKDVLPYWVLYGYGPGGSGLVNFGDSNVASYFYLTMLAVGRVNGLPQANWYIARAGGGGPLDRLLYLDPDAPVEAPPASWPTSRAFADIGWAFLRTGWGPHDRLLAFVSSGSRLGHNHFDQNHFVLNVAGEWLIKDNGYQDYNPGPKNLMTSGTLGHNAALIDGQGQTAKGGGRIAAAFLSEAVDYVAGDASAAYSGTALAGWIRHVFFVKPSQVVLLDEYVLQREDAQPAWLIHPNGQVLAGGQPLSVGFSGMLSGFDIRSGRAGVTAHLLWPAQQAARFLLTPGAEEYGPYLMFEPAVTGRRVFVATLLDLYTLDELRRSPSEYDLAALQVLSDGGRSVLRTQDGLLYRAEQVGDRLELALPVPASGTYRLAVSFATASTYGAVQVELDGTPVGPAVDTYSPRFGDTGLVALGEVQLDGGTHVLGLRIVEGDPASRGRFVLLQRIRLEPAGAEGPALDAPAFADWKELPSGRRVSLADVNAARLRFATADAAGRDLFWFSLQEAAATSAETEGLWTDAVNAWVRVNHRTGVEAFALAGGRRLTVDGAVYVASTADVNLALAPKAPGRWLLEIDADEAGTVRVRVPVACYAVTAVSAAKADAGAPGSRDEGAAVPEANGTVPAAPSDTPVPEPDGAMLRLDVTPGRTRIEVTACSA